MSKEVKKGHRGERSLLALKVEFLEWYISRDPRKGTQGNWAKEHDLAGETVSRWLHDDDEFDKLLAAVERGQEKRWAQVMETMFLRATDPEDSMGVQAASFIAKVYGKFKPEKVEHSGRMTLSDFLAGGGYTKDETVARVN